MSKQLTKEEILEINNTRTENVKPEEIKWKWCFHCQHNTRLCPFCDGNSCACGCIQDTKSIGLTHEDMPCEKFKYWEAERELSNLKIVPDTPIQKDFDDTIKYWIDHKDTDYWQKIKTLNDGYDLDEIYYTNIEWKAKEFGFDIPSMEYLTETYGITFKMNAKTGFEFNEECRESNEKEKSDTRFKGYPLIVDPTGWKDKEQYKTRRMGWPEFVRRREDSVLDR